MYFVFREPNYEYSETSRKKDITSESVTWSESKLFWLKISHKNEGKGVCGSGCITKNVK